MLLVVWYKDRYPRNVRESRNWMNHHGTICERVSKFILRWRCQRKKKKTLPPDHLLFDSAPNLGPLISRWEINKFQNCWHKSDRILEVLKLLFQEFLNWSGSQRDTSGPILGALSNNRWSGGSLEMLLFLFRFWPSSVRWENGGFLCFICLPWSYTHSSPWLDCVPHRVHFLRLVCRRWKRSNQTRWMGAMNCWRRFCSVFQSAILRGPNFKLLLRIRNLNAA
jgi:hypothetical protein